MSGIESLEFRVEVWDAGDNRLEKLVALCANSIVAKGAYEAALKLNPRANLVVRQRAGAGISLVTLADPVARGMAPRPASRPRRGPWCFTRQTACSSTTVRVCCSATQKNREVAMMTKAFVIVMVPIVVAGLAACAGTGRNGYGTEYVGRFDNDENRRPMLVYNTNPNSSPQALVYGDGEH
jgi:hypothetical protein